MIPPGRRYRMSSVNLQPKLTVGDAVPDLRVLALDGAKRRLLDLSRRSRPLVLNFGSCT